MIARPQYPTHHNSGQSLPPITLFRAWLQVGLQSFGGGMSTLSLIQRVFVQQNGWLTDEQFVRVNAISQIAPGINILSITISLGEQLGGALGIAASLLGLLLPSVAITVLMTAGYASVRHLPAVQQAFHAIMPATIGIGLLSAWSMTKALARESKVTGGRLEVAAAAVVLFLSGFLVWRGAPVIAVLCGGGLIMACARSASAGNRRDATSPTAEAEDAAMQAAEAEESR